MWARRVGGMTVNQAARKDLRVFPEASPQLHALPEIETGPGSLSLDGAAQHEVVSVCRGTMDMGRARTVIADARHRISEPQAFVCRSSMH